jgi:ABC-2 type transport system ATP-binding protein
VKPIEVRGLRKTYGPIVAVDDVEFSLEAAEILAIAGPDGAGKTSLFRSICGLVDFDAGDVHVAGRDVRTDFDAVKPSLGYMPQSFSLYPDLSVEENLAFYAGLFGLGRDEFRTRRERLYEFSGLHPFARRRAEALSGGMKQKLALSCNLIHNPGVLVLDEPTTGVDPLSRKQFWDILAEIRSEGASILLSTPYMDEVGRADRAIFMDRGKFLAAGAPEDLVGLYKGRVFKAAVEVTGKQMRALRAGGTAAARFGSTLRVYAPEGAAAGGVAAALGGAGVDASGLTEARPGLEDVFVQLMGRRPDNTSTDARPGEAPAAGE